MGPRRGMAPPRAWRPCAAADRTPAAAHTVVESPSRTARRLQRQRLPACGQTCPKGRRPVRAPAANPHGGIRPHYTGAVGRGGHGGGLLGTACRAARRAAPGNARLPMPFGSAARPMPKTASVRNAGAASPNRSGGSKVHTVVHCGAGSIRPAPGACPPSSSRIARRSVF